MKKQVKRMLSLVLMVCMLASMLVACVEGTNSKETTNSTQKENEGTQGESQEASTGAPSDAFEHDPLLNELGKEPYVKEPVTITIGLKQNTNILSYDDNHYTKMMEELTGVNLEFVLFAGGDAQEKLNAMAMGNEKLPDIILWSMSDAQAMQWGEEGYIVPLEDYFEHSSLYSKENFERTKNELGLDIIDYLSTADGHLWQFPQFTVSTTNAQTDRTWVYGPWLEKLGIEIPKTTEDFENMLIAFKTQDPNGNGKPDEIPLLGSSPVEAGKGSIFWQYIMNAFTQTTLKKDFLVSENGKLSLSYTKDEWKEGVKYIAGLVAEGLIDPVSYTQNQDSFVQIMNGSGDQIVGVFSYALPDFIAKDHPSRQEWILLDPLTGPEGYCSTGYNQDAPKNSAFITTSCEHPEIAFRVLDTMCSEIFTITNRWGKQGENWDFVEDIKDDPRFADKDFSGTWMGYPALFYEYNSIWSQPGNAHWMNAGPAFRLAEVVSGYYACTLDPVNNAANYQLSQKLEAYEAVKPAEPITKIKFANADDQAEYDQLKNELKTYVYEKLALWSTGKADVDAEWDAYLKELDRIGANRLLEIAQKGWKAE